MLNALAFNVNTRKANNVSVPVDAAVLLASLGLIAIGLKQVAQFELTCLSLFSAIHRRPLRYRNW